MQERIIANAQYSSCPCPVRGQPPTIRVPCRAGRWRGVSHGSSACWSGNACDPDVVQ